MIMSILWKKNNIIASQFVIQICILPKSLNNTACCRINKATAKPNYRGNRHGILFYYRSKGRGMILQSSLIPLVPGNTKNGEEDKGDEFPFRS